MAPVRDMVFSTKYLGLAAGTALIVPVIHLVVHYGFIPNQLFATGSVQATAVLMGTLFVGVLLSAYAAHNLSGFRAFLVVLFAWLLHVPAHDGVHALYVPVEEILAFGSLGIPESGITLAVLYGTMLVAVYGEMTMDMA